jgi:hypothetical protein
LLPLLTCMLNNRYEFSLHALKCVFVSAGNLKCKRHQTLRDKNLPEQEIVIQSIRETVVSK